MVGEGGQWMTARPTIVALCSKTRIAQRICDLLRNIECMKTLNLGFEYMAHKERVLLVAGMDETSCLSNVSRSLCGLQVLASTYPPSLDAKWSQTTVGGTLEINGEDYCLTVAHAFHLQTSASGDDGSDSSLDLSESSDCSDDFSPAPDSQSSVSVLTCPPGTLYGLDLGLYLNTVSDPSVIKLQHREKVDCTPTAVTDIEMIGESRLLRPQTRRLPSLLLCAEMDWHYSKSKTKDSSSQT